MDHPSLIAAKWASSSLWEVPASSGWELVDSITDKLGKVKQVTYRREVEGAQYQMVLAVDLFGGYRYEAEVGGRSIEGVSRKNDPLVGLKRVDAAIAKQTSKGKPLSAEEEKALHLLATHPDSDRDGDLYVRATTEQIARWAGWDPKKAYRVMSGLERKGLVEQGVRRRVDHQMSKGDEFQDIGWREWELYPEKVPAPTLEAIGFKPWGRSARVVHRYLLAKAQPGRLVPKFQKAMEAIEQGDASLLVEFCQEVLAITHPDGTSGDVAPWYWALGTAKRNAIKLLSRGLRDVIALRNEIIKAPEKHRFFVKPDEWLKQLRTLEIAVKDSGPQEIQHGPWKVIPMEGITQKEVARCLELLDQTSAKLRSSFPQVLYGDVYLSTHLKGTVGAQYTPSGDRVYLKVSTLDKFSSPLHPIIHELGHRFDHKFLKPDLKKRFWALSTRKVFETIQYDRDLRSKVADEVVAMSKQMALGKTPQALSPELVAWLPYCDAPKQKTSDFLAGKITEKELHQAIMGGRDIEVLTDKLLHGPLSVSSYGATKPSENWAEAFAFYALRVSDMPAELAAIVAEAAKG